MNQIKMLLKKYLIPLAVTLLTGCELTSDASWMIDDPVQPVPQSAATVTSLYNNPKEDAQIAIAVKDFRLLAFANEGTTAPGIPDNYKLTRLEQRCGMRFLPGTGEVVDGRFDALQQQKIFDYAVSYNQLVLAACETFYGKMRR